MADNTNRNQDSPDKKKFIRESVGKELSGKRRARVIGIIKIILAAVLFGIVATCTSVVSGPFVKRIMGQGETEATYTQYTIPKDDPNGFESESESNTIVETEAPTESTSAAEMETKSIKEEVSSVLETYKYSITDATTINKALSQIALKSDGAVVTVHSVQTHTDWFDNPIENAGVYTGIIINKTEDEIIILLPKDATETADSIQVTLHEDGEYAATLRRTDPLSGLSIVAVPTTEIDNDLVDAITPIALGNSYAVQRGDMVVAVGSPSGIAYSYGYGNISYVAGGVETVDGSISALYTNMNIDGKYGTWVLNTSGELIGWVKAADDNQLSYITGVSEYKSLLERMSNGQAYPYLGVIVADVKNSGNPDMPEGLYVKTVEGGSPAYQAGIQPGDIITEIGNTEITGIRSFQAELDKLHSDDAITIKVMRNSMDDYTSIDYQVVVGSR